MNKKEKKLMKEVEGLKIYTYSELLSFKSKIIFKKDEQFIRSIDFLPLLFELKQIIIELQKDYINLNMVKRSKKNGK